MLTEKFSFSILLIVGFLAFAEFSSWMMAPGPSPCLIQTSQQVSKRDGEKTCPTLSAGFLILAERGFDFAKHNDNDKAIVALFTIVLALSTIGLWVATIRLWRAGEDQRVFAEVNAQRQLRAYLFISRPRLIVFNENKTCTYELFIKNYGLTPAHDVEVVTNHEFLDPDPIPFPEFEEPTTLSRSAVAPNGQIVITPETKAMITAADIQNVASGAKAFFIWGQIRYVDVFQRPQTTRFRLKLAGDSHGALVVCEKGNSAT